MYFAIPEIQVTNLLQEMIECIYNTTSVRNVGILTLKEQLLQFSLLCKNSSHISLRDCNLSFLSINQLITKLENIPLLRSLDLQDNGYSEQQKEEIKELYKTIVTM